MSTKLIRGINHLKPHKGFALTIGNFDGVHLGHQALIKKLLTKSKELNVPSLVMTFEPQPLEFFNQKAGRSIPPRITRLREKFVELRKLGVDYLLVIPFNEAFASLTAEEFVSKILVEKLQAKYILIGDDFGFGKGRKGDFYFLKKSGLNVESMPTFMLDDTRVSSTRIREALSKDEKTLVERLLGRNYTMIGRVAHGDKLGRKLGFPTANIFLHRATSPVLGIYAVQMHGIAKEPLPGVANVGIRPTVGGTRCLLEVHLFDFDRDIYNQHVRVEFLKKFRDEVWFDNLELLKNAIADDVKLAREYFNERL